MATNFEFYKDEILKIAKDTNSCPTLTKNGTLAGCSAIPCNLCAFHAAHCPLERFEWLYAEHIEQPKLTKRERAFCEAVQTGWIARDCDMSLLHFERKPVFKRDSWNAEGYYTYLEALGLNDHFMFIKDTDADYWSVEDLLKLEVVEE